MSNKCFALTFIFNLSCATNLGIASSMNVLGTFLCETLILPMYMTSKNCESLSGASPTSDKLRRLLKLRSPVEWLMCDFLELAKRSFFDITEPSECTLVIDPLGDDIAEMFSADRFICVEDGRLCCIPSVKWDICEGIEKSVSSKFQKFQLILSRKYEINISIINCFDASKAISYFENIL